MMVRRRKRTVKKRQTGGVLGTIAATLIPMIVDRATSLAKAKKVVPLYALKYPGLWKRRKENEKKAQAMRRRSLRYSVWMRK